MSVYHRHLRWDATVLLTFIVQTSDALVHVLPVQLRPRPSIQCVGGKYPNGRIWQDMDADCGFQDTNFLSHTVRAKLPLVETMMDCLYAACTPIITDCVMAELEKLGPKYRLALQIARDERFERSACDHKGTYADDCIVDRIMKHRIYIVATNDKDLCRRIRKVPGVPIMQVARGKYLIERLPGAPDS